LPEQVTVHRDYWLSEARATLMGAPTGWIQVVFPIRLIEEDISHSWCHPERGNCGLVIPGSSSLPG